MACYLASEILLELVGKTMARWILCKKKGLVGVGGKALPAILLTVQCRSGFVIMQQKNCRFTNDLLCIIWYHLAMLREYANV